MVHPRATGGCPRFLRARNDGAAHHSGRPADETILPPLVLLARHQPRDALRARRARHGNAGADRPRLLERAAHSRSAALPLSEGAEPRAGTGFATASAAAASRHSSTSSGSASLPASCGSVSATHGHASAARCLASSLVSSHGRPSHSARARRPAVDATILICTYNRAAYLRDTLDSLAALDMPASIAWDVLVVDNNSSDDTRAVVETRARDLSRAAALPVRGASGKSNALNTGMAATAARVIVFTDDDVKVPRGWLHAGVAPLLERARHRLHRRSGPADMGRPQARVARRNRQSRRHHRGEGSRRLRRSSSRIAGRRRLA